MEREQRRERHKTPRDYPTPGIRRMDRAAGGLAEACNLPVEAKYDLIDIMYGGDAD